jgi:hypothetical protein
MRQNPGKSVAFGRSVHMKEREELSLHPGIFSGERLLP